MGTHDLAGEGQAYTGTLGPCGEEGVEDVVGVLGGDGVTVVGDVDLGVVGGVDEGGDADKRDVCGNGTGSGRTGSSGKSNNGNRTGYGRAGGNRTMVRNGRIGIGSTSVTGSGDRTGK